MPTPDEILDLAFRRASESAAEPVIDDTGILERMELICRNIQNRAGVRVVLACTLAKVHQPAVDIRKPYTEIDGDDTYSGRRYDETYITPFIYRHRLPCKPTTAFLTPAWRNRDQVLTTDLNLVGRPPELYRAVLQLLDDVYQERITAFDLLTETMRRLLMIRDEQAYRLTTLISDLATTEGGVTLSSEAIVRLIEQHLQQPRASRLPVLVIAAIYQTIAAKFGEAMRPLQAHNAADRQSGTLGDLEVILINTGQLVTCYEIKTRIVTREDVDSALQKISAAGEQIENYIFVTTREIDNDVKVYIDSLYAATQGIEFAILDCISFLKHFLQLFHR